MASDGAPPLVAIIGSACRLPGGASSPSNLWKLLKEPRDVISDIPRDRFHWEGVYRADASLGSIKTKQGYFLKENIRHFDPHFFGISPAEAVNLDPQHRLLLENVYEAIESAGLCLEDLQGTDAGVFVGLMANEYYDNANFDVDASSGQILTTGTARSMASNRISYIFDFRGPSITVDSACSSSLMAVHLAVASLRRNESTVAFAGGAHLNLNTHGFKALTRMKMISSDGRSKMFDELADGYGRGEGTAVICLKLLDAAIRDGDPIECIIRDTGTNQDGRTKGITMPNSEAQADLIRRTYRNAGLDPTSKDSRPSFFEAHGTGTLVGDPLEAQAIEAAFFPLSRDYAEDEIIHIGSIKTIIGHTEGAAGLAGLLRAALAIRHGVIPPNLLFGRMNSSVQPFNKHLHLPTTASPWPNLPRGSPRRASVNSFGFGGANVHAILESYTQPPRIRMLSTSSLPAVEMSQFTPFTFSATSEQALIAVLKGYIDYLKSHRDIVRMEDLAWTLQYRRSQGAYRYAAAASTPNELCIRLVSTLNEAAANPTSGLLTRAVQSASSKSPRITGVFTGQGAQWPSMGKDLIGQSPFARKLVGKLDATLQSLPTVDRPSWNLVEEIMIDSSRSRIAEAEFAQPLTTAVQILLVDLLRVAGIRLDAVVGHSSGEIAAAYAAGFIQAEDAIRIAYYRGLHSKHAGDRNGERGGMIATSLSPDEARKFCHQPRYADQLVVAAYNSPSSTTLAGDMDAVGRALDDLQGQATFVRKLQVDKAYHSHHMKPCITPYLHALEHLQIEPIQAGIDAPVWYSSVICGKRMTFTDRLDGSYWVDNLSSPVQFSEAITTTVSDRGIPDLIIEIGPHPALEQPVKQTLSPSAVAYTSMLRRGMTAVVSFSQALGFIWCRFGRSAVDFAKVDDVLSNGSQREPRQLKYLPTYPWFKEKEYWYDNRCLNRRFQSITKPAELLGVEWEIGASHEAKWRSFLDPRETPWLLQHKLDGVAVLPGAAYIVMAASAAKRVFRSQSMQMIDIRDLHFEIPIVFPDTDTSIEIILTVLKIHGSTTHAEAEFFIDFCSNSRNNELITAARGTIHVRFGSDADRAHPEPFELPSHLTTIDTDQFYDTLAKAGYGYSGPFKNIQQLKRRMDFATGEITPTSSELIIHPSLIDGLFQASFAAENFPGDSLLPSFQVPSLIRSIKIFPIRCEEVLSSASAIHLFRVEDGSQQNTPLSEPLPFGLVRTKFSEYAGILGSTSGTLCQVEGLVTTPFQLSAAEDDVFMFRETTWTPCSPYQILATTISMSTNRDQPLALACERVALYYVRVLNDNITFEEERAAHPNVRVFLEHARLTLVEAALGVHPHLDPDWLKDDKDFIASIVKKYPGSIDLKCIEKLGRAYPTIIAGQDTAISILLGDGDLNEIYRSGLGFQEVNNLFAEFVGKLTEHLPRLNVLEVGGGTGSATRKLLATSFFAHYTFTDISPGFIGPAQAAFKQYGDRMSFGTFDINRDPEVQGFELHSYELVVASNVIHASANVPAILKRLRSLLRPGGYLACVELADVQTIRNSFIMGTLDGWWSGHGVDRYWTPAMSKQKWHKYLKRAGFGGIDAITPSSDPTICPYRVFCSQAVDERVLTLRKPLTQRLPHASDELLILGTKSLKYPDLLQQVEILVAPSFSKIHRLSSLDDLESTLTVPYAVLSFLDLDSPVFPSLTPLRWAAFQKLLSDATDVLWVTHGALGPMNINELYPSMMVGLGRSIRNEMSHLRLACIDFDVYDQLAARQIAECTLRWYAMGKWSAEGWSDDALFPQQTELAIKNAQLFAPIVRKSKQRNDRYNSQHRRIFEKVLAYDQPVELYYKLSANRYVLRGLPYVPGHMTSISTALVGMFYTTVFAFKIKNTGYLFLGFGILDNGSSVLTLSDAIGSILRLPSSSLQPCNVSRELAQRYLNAVAARLVADRLVNSSRSSGVLVVLCRDPLWMSAIQTMAINRSLRVVFVTSQPNFETQRATYLHHNSLDHILRQQIPMDTSMVANLSTHQDDEILFSRISDILSLAPVKMRDNSAFFKNKSSGFDEVRSSSKCTSAIKDCMKEVTLISNSQWQSANTFILTPTDALKEQTHPASTIVDWTSDEELPVTILRATKDVDFSPTKTYLIVGSSDIAQSICEWMISSGARFIAVASRNVEHLTDWAKDMATKGAFIHVAAMDVTNGDSVTRYIAGLRAGHSSCQVAMPAFGGVIHLALVLRDTIFANMSFEDLKTVTDVKEKGSLILHEQLKDDNLDFFILTSSISYVVGNPGQANYVSGNAFMVSLANHRRRLGLSASVVHLGRVSGIGYILRTAKDKSHAFNSEDLRSVGVYPISERDLHQIFAEAVLASPASSETSFEIITGLRDIEPDMLGRCAWAKNPRFAHLLTSASATRQAQPAATTSVRQQLNEQASAPCTSATDKTYDIVKTAFVEKLKILLQMDTIDMDVNLIELGIDSLVAADVSNWARKELKVEVPNTLILGGASAVDIVDVVVKQLNRG